VIVKKSTDSENIFNSTTRCTKFVTNNGEAVPHFKTYYENINEMGRHYCMWTRHREEIKRQYTICNSLTPAIYTEILKLARINTETGDTCIEINKDILMNPSESDGCWMSYKNYKAKSGVATAMKRTRSSMEHRGVFINFGCQGPVGKGLGLDLLNLEGLHVAFTAGTGSLVFIDLVARIFLQNYSKLHVRES
jgi:hypothetical protein